MVEHLTTVDTHTRGVRGGEHLLTANFARCIEIYLLACKVEGKSKKTLDIYRINLRSFQRFLAPDDILLADVNRNDVRLFLNALQEKRRTPGTVHCYYRGLKTFFTWLVNEGLLDISPMANMKPPKLPRKIITPLDNRDIVNILLLCSGGSFLEVRNRAIVLMFLDTGLRLAELSGIRIEDVNFDNETIRVMGKGSKERVVRIGRTVQKALLKYLLMRNYDGPELWLTEECRPLTVWGVKITIRRLIKRAGVSNTKGGAHILRHTAAINCLRNGMDVFALQVMLGHSSLEMTRRYVSSLGASDMCQAHEKASPVDNLGIK